jgi:hypothetical protein
MILNSSCSANQETIDGGNYVPIITKDGQALAINIDYSLTLDLENIKNTSLKEIGKDTVISTINTIILSQLLKKSDRYSANEIKQMIDDSSIENILLTEIKEEIYKDRHLKKITVVDISMRYE